jgi:hypothetical protein
MFTKHTTVMIMWAFFLDIPRLTILETQVDTRSMCGSSPLMMPLPKHPAASAPDKWGVLRLHNRGYGGELPEQSGGSRTSLGNAWKVCLALDSLEEKSRPSMDLK